MNPERKTPKSPDKQDRENVRMDVMGKCSRGRNVQNEVKAEKSEKPIERQTIDLRTILRGQRCDHPP